MAVTLVKSDNGSFQQLTITSGETGTKWIKCSPGRYIKFGVNTGHGATYDVVTQLGDPEALDYSGTAISPTTYTESSGETAGYAGKFNPGMKQIGINITGAPSSDLVIELSEGK